MASLREELWDSIPGRDVTNVSLKHHVQNAAASVHPRGLPHWSRWLQCQTPILSTVKVIQKYVQLLQTLEHGASVNCTNLLYLIV